MALTKVSTPAIKDEAITLAKLLHGDSNSNGKFLRANNGADPTFESVITDLVNDTTPQLGGSLDVNNKNVNFGDSTGTGVNRLRMGASNDLQIYHSGTVSFIDDLVGAGDGISIRAKNIRLQSNANIGAKSAINCIANGAVELFYNDSEKLETVSNGVIIDNNCRIENINNQVASMVNAKSSLEYKVHQTNGQSALQGAIKSNGISGWGGDLEFYTKPADSNPNGNLQRRARLTEAGELMVHDQPYSMVSRSTGQSVPTVTGTIIVFDSQHYDRGNAYNHTNGRFTAPVDGVYQVNIQVQYTGNVNQTHAGLYRNGSNPGVGGSFDPWCNWGDGNRAAYFAQAVYCSAGDYLQAVTYHDNGSNRTLEGGRTKMTIYLLG